MSAVVFAYDHSRDPMHPGDLADKIATALALSVAPRVDIAPAQITVTHQNVTEANRTAIQAVIDSYVLDPIRSSYTDDVGGALASRARKGITANINYMQHAAIPGGVLTTTQLSSIVRTLSDQVDILTRENTALIRLSIGVLDSTEGT